MKKILLETSFSKIYMIVMIIITLLILGGYFSYAMFTVSKERGNAISIVTGNLTFDLKVDGTTGNTLTVKANRSREFEVTLTNPNNRTARFNFYYLGDISSEVNIGYLESDEYNKTPEAVGVNLEKSGSSGSSNVYRILVENESDNDISIELGVSVGLDYNDLSLEDNEHLFTKIELPNVVDQLLVTNKVQTEKDNMFNYTSKGDIYTDATSGTISNDPDYVTNGLYSMNDEDGISYYYRGNIENNNVQFGEYASDYYVYSNNFRYFQTLESCQEYNRSCSESNRVKLASAGDKMYWKIVRVNGDGSLRLIYNGTSPNPDNSDLAHFYAVGASPYNLEANDPKYAGYTYDRNTNETDSFIKKEVDTWYSNTLGNSNYDSMVQNGRFCSDSSGYKLGTEYGFSGANYNVFSSFDRLAMAGEGISFSRPNSPSLICPDTDETYGGSYNLKAGLITADELVLAGESMLISGNSYLNIGSSNVGYWSMTPADFDGGDVDIWYKAEILNNGYVNFNYAIRPLINVTIDDGFTSGDGTISSPYVIES